MEIGGPLLALIVDNDARTRSFLQDTLRLNGYTVEQAVSGEEALEKLRDTPYNLAVMDVQLGDRVDGQRVLEAIRWRWPGMAVVILTANGSLDSALAAIREGVDGYLLKPVEPAELCKTIQNALEKRRQSGSPMPRTTPDELHHGPFVVNVKKHLVTVDSRVVDLTPGEFLLLLALVRNADRVLTHQELARELGGCESSTVHEARDLTKWHIHRLRRKVEPDASRPRYILNVRGVGYRLGS